MRIDGRDAGARAQGTLESPDGYHAPAWLDGPYDGVVRVQAARIDEAFVVLTAGGEREGRAGDYLVESCEDGSRWPVPAVTFASVYRRVHLEGSDAAGAPRWEGSA